MHAKRAGREMTPKTICVPRPSEHTVVLEANFGTLMLGARLHSAKAGTPSGSLKVPDCRSL